MIVTVNTKQEPFEFPISHMTPDSFAVVVHSPNSTIKKGDIVYRTISHAGGYPYQFVGQGVQEPSTSGNQYIVRYLQPGESIIIQED